MTGSKLIACRFLRARDAMFNIPFQFSARVCSSFWLDNINRSFFGPLRASSGIDTKIDQKKYLFPRLKSQIEGGEAGVLDGAVLQNNRSAGSSWAGWQLVNWHRTLAGNLLLSKACWVCVYQIILWLEKLTLPVGVTNRCYYSWQNVRMSRGLS